MSYDDFDGVLGGEDDESTAGAKKVVGKMTDQKIDGLVDGLAPKQNLRGGGYYGNSTFQGRGYYDDEDYYPRAKVVKRQSSYRSDYSDLGSSVGGRPAGAPALSHHIRTPILLPAGGAIVQSTLPAVTPTEAYYSQAQWSQLVDNMLYDLEKSLKIEAGLVAVSPFGKDQMRRELSKFLFDNFRHEDETGRKRYLDVGGVKK